MNDKHESPPGLDAIERQIDEAFEENLLTTIPFTQAAWTVLSAAEDLHLFRITSEEIDHPTASVFADSLVNALTYPLRACQRLCERSNAIKLQRQLIDEHYGWASEWLHSADDYAQFCTVFPLARAGELDLEAVGDELIPRGWAIDDLRYESYDRLIAKKREAPPPLTESIAALIGTLRGCMKASGNVYSVDFSRRLMTALQDTLGQQYEQRHDLPSGWVFSQFSLIDFRKVIVCLQLMSHCWFFARQIVASSNVRGAAFSSAVWTPRKSELVTLISRHTSVDRLAVGHILRYLTFGEMGIRSPDIAIQPLIDLDNGQYAISPFVLMHLNVERNLCVLLNQVTTDRNIYSRLVNTKERQAREQILETLTGLGLRFEYGDVGDTDVDLAIIDDSDRCCLCLEIKWFIEPAEVREILDRSKELVKGVKQSLRVRSLFKSADARLFNLLRIENDYDFLSAVGSSNFIGSHRTQHIDVPIIKLWHLCATIKQRGLKRTLDWLKKREYLPTKDVDYAILDRNICSGRWTTKWYGIQPLREFPPSPTN